MPPSDVCRGGQWRLHDRTHLEFVADYAADPSRERQDYVWEAFFFFPRSLRLNASTYSKRAMQRDFQSYVRFSVDEVPWEEFVNIVKKAARCAREDEAACVRELQLLGCQLRVTIARGLDRLLALVAVRSEQCELQVQAYLTGLRAVLELFRAEPPRSRIPVVLSAARRVDEDISVVAESALAKLALHLREAGYVDLAQSAASEAVLEARYHADRSSQAERRGTHRAGADERELRKHFLKRFTSSALWLKTEISPGAQWVLQLLYALAASVAMVFAILAAFYHGTQVGGHLNNVWGWALLVVLGYAGKDRIKATLQGVFSAWVSRHFPDRQWQISAGRDHDLVATVDERSRFVDNAEIPAAVRSTRSADADHHIELRARPERVLWHRKVFDLRGTAIRNQDQRFTCVSEILRLDLSRWLVHTDDPEQRVYLADPDAQEVYETVARRIYEISVIYRVRRKQDEAAPWQHSRVVIRRDGIVRIVSVA